MARGYASAACLDAVCGWYQEANSRLEDLSRVEACEVLLAAHALDVVDDRQEALVDTWARNWGPEDFESHETFFESILRHLVLLHFGAAPQARETFFAYWTQPTLRRSLDLIEMCSIVNLVLLNPDRAGPDLRRYARGFYLRHKSFRSDKASAWAVNCLAIIGRSDLASERAQDLMARRLKNGSWGSELRRTVSCSYALAKSGLVSSEDLAPSIEYADGRIRRGLATDASILGQMIKLLHCVGLLDVGRVQRLRDSASARTVVFVSYSRGQLDVAEVVQRELESIDGVNVWLDRSGIELGDEWLRTISSAIDRCVVFLMIVAKETVKSPWFRKEVIYAVNRRKRLYALLLEGVSLPPELELLLGDVQVKLIRVHTCVEQGVGDLRATIQQLAGRSPH